MPDPEVIDPSRPTPNQNGNGQTYYEPPGTGAPNGMTPQQIIQMILQNGFVGYMTKIPMIRPTQRGPEKYETTPAKLIAENTQAILALNHTLHLLLEGVIQCQWEECDKKGNVIDSGVDDVNPIQAMYDLTAAIGESCDIANQQMGKGKRRRST